MSELFYYTGAVVWLFIGVCILSFLTIAARDLWRRDVLPSLFNLRFSLFGKPKGEKRSYYELWCGLSPWSYRYYIRGNGRGHFSRCAMKRLIREARKETKRISPDS